jgi:hypothetical protein
MKRKHFLTLAALAWICAQARPGFAQTPEERAGARAAADQGFDAFERGDWAGALDLFGRAESLVHSPVHQLFLARSQAKLGRLIEAQEAYLRVLRDTLPANAGAAARQAQQEAERELAALEPRIPFVTVEVEGASSAEKLEVLQDGRLLPPALVGVARPLNPGEHTWQARSGSRHSESEKRTVQAGSKLKLKLRLPEAEIELVPQQGTSAASPALAGQPPAALAPGAPAAELERPSSGVSAWVYVGFGVAAAGAGLGTGYLLHQGNIEDRITRGCPPEGCYATPRNLRLKSDADAAGQLAALGFTIGGVGLASAVAFWLLSPGGSSEEAGSVASGGAAPRVQLSLSPNGAQLSGSF